MVAKELPIALVWNNEKLLLGEVGAHGEGGETQLVGDVDGCPALHGHVQHLDVVEHHQDVGHSASIDVLYAGLPKENIIFYS